MKKMIKIKETIEFDDKSYQLIGILLIILIIMTILIPGRFATINNLIAMCYQFPEIGLFSIGIAITMIIGGADLSIVSIANLSAVISGIIIIQKMPSNANSELAIKYILISLLTTLLIGIISGFINGYIIGYMKVFPILVTLGTQNLYFGIAVILTGGIGVYGTVPELLYFIGSGKLFNIIPVPLAYFTIFFLITYILIHKTPYGIKAQLYGSNKIASYYSGIDNKKVVLKTYILSSIIGSFTGFLILARTSSAKGDYGITLVLQALLVSVLGGVSPLGGKGNLINVLLAVLSLQLIDTGFNFMRISPYVRASTYGGMLIISIAIEYLIKKYKEKIEKRKLNKKKY